MPNWCHNTLEVEGPKDEIAEFVNKARKTPPETEHEQPLFFANFVPEPDYDGKQDWWAWRCENWGSKWEPNFGQPFIAIGTEDSDPGAEKDQLDIQDLDEETMRVSYEFDTPWGPPGPVIEAAAQQHPNLKFRFVWGEPGGDFGGKCEWAEGEATHFEEGAASDYLPEEKMWF